MVIHESGATRRTGARGSPRVREMGDAGEQRGGGGAAARGYFTSNGRGNGPADSGTPLMQILGHGGDRPTIRRSPRSVPVGNGACKWSSVAGALGAMIFLRTAPAPRLPHLHRRTAPHTGRWGPSPCRPSETSRKGAAAAQGEPPRPHRGSIRPSLAVRSRGLATSLERQPPSPAASSKARAVPGSRHGSFWVKSRPDGSSPPRWKRWPLWEPSNWDVVRLPPKAPGRNMRVPIHYCFRRLPHCFFRPSPPSCAARSTSCGYKEPGIELRRHGETGPPTSQGHPPHNAEGDT